MTTEPDRAEPLLGELRSERRRSMKGAIAATAPTELTTMIYQALATSDDDAQLAGELVRSGVPRQVLDLATLTNDEGREALGYSSANFRATVNQTKSLPEPAVESRRWASTNITEHEKQRRYRRADRGRECCAQISHRA
ncbi:hypothetical protein I2485_15180 [Nesterenkonia sp. E16_7]|uniref:hypothetical protein n=1 Tax=unclassified Nesterenkonia TaxID=2629769 RepID=UPI001A914EBE|nr:MULTISPECIES: hypothetical protein [unclassified Nesterenkonia]MBO0596293.1 hypothetical protein [Nesterenkonia sp. E16_10]MBO0599993.1 hypothetical protein [Nesterenkonia sp. E16_7]